LRPQEVDLGVNINGIERFLGDYWLNERAQPVRKIYAGKIAVIGSGPAGLSCAYFLCRIGYPVTVFEALPVLGGMLRIGIPEYRLPRDVLDAQINYIRDMGVESKQCFNWSRC
jgi:NADPH-dependent glutamate synthase beta subunit-like oxidoreductase